MLNAFAVDETELVYTNMSDFPLYGKVVQEDSCHYYRLPSSYEKTTREALRYLGKMSAGLYIRFRSDSPQLACRWVSTYKTSMNHMTDTGSRGVDLYAWDEGGWKYAGVGRPYQDSSLTYTTMVENMEPKMREYTLYLSLYDGMESVEIGVPEGYVIEKPVEHVQSHDGSIVMYGTSILHGCSASRPGKCFSALIGRALDREVINLGFSGNAFLDYDIAKLMTQVKNPAVFVLDNVPNCNPQQIRERTEHFIEILRQAHPNVPVIMVEEPQFSMANFSLTLAEEVRSVNEAQREMYHKLKKQGVKNLYLLKSKKIFGKDNDKCVDGCHYTDVGMEDHARALLPLLRKAIH